MKQACENCFFAKIIPPPKGEEPPIPPNTITRRLLCFSWTEKVHPSVYFTDRGTRNRWLARMDKHENNIICTRYPSTEEKLKTDFCGEFKQKEE